MGCLGDYEYEKVVVFANKSNIFGEVEFRQANQRWLYWRSFIAPISKLGTINKRQNEKIKIDFFDNFTCRNFLCSRT